MKIVCFGITPAQAGAAFRKKIGTEQKEHDVQNVSRKRRKGWLAKFMNVSNRDIWMALMVFVIGFLTAYSASAEVAPPTQAEWEAYGKLKPVKKFDYDKVYNDIDSDLARLEAKEDQFAQNLPIQLTGPMHAVAKKQYRGNSRVR